MIGRKNARALARLGTLIRRCIQCSKELQTCYEHWLRRQIEIIDPRVIVLLGKIPVSQLLHVTRSLQELHGVLSTGGSSLYQVQYHPAAGMRSPNLGAAMKRDFGKLKRVSLIRRRRRRNNNGRA